MSLQCLRSPMLLRELQSSLLPQKGKRRMQAGCFPFCPHSLHTPPGHFLWLGVSSSSCSHASSAAVTTHDMPSPAQHYRVARNAARQPVVTVAVPALPGASDAGRDPEAREPVISCALSPGGYPWHPELEVVDVERRQCSRIATLASSQAYARPAVGRAPWKLSRFPGGLNSGGRGSLSLVRNLHFNGFPSSSFRPGRPGHPGTPVTNGQVT